MVMPRATEQADERKGVDEVQLPRRLQSADELMTRRARHRRPSLKKCHMLPSVTRTLSLSRDPFSCQRIREHFTRAETEFPANYAIRGVHFMHPNFARVVVGNGFFHALPPPTTP